MRQRIKESNPMCNCIKKNKILRNKFNQGGDNLYSENCKILMKKKMKTTQINGKLFCVQEWPLFVSKANHSISQ